MLTEVLADALEEQLPPHRVKSEHQASYHLGCAHLAQWDREGKVVDYQPAQPPTPGGGVPDGRVLAAKGTGPRLDSAPSDTLVSSPLP